MSLLFAGLMVFGLAVSSTEAESDPAPTETRQVETLAEVAGGTGGLVVDSKGNVYSADFGAVLGNPETAGKKIYRITPGGETSVFAEGLDGASGIAIAADGTIFQSNIRGSKVSRVTPDGKVTTFADEGFRAPVGIIVDPDGTLWVNNCGGGSIQKVTAAGESSLFVKSDLFRCANGLTRDPQGNLYVANFFSGDVLKVTPKAEVSVLATLPGNGNGHLIYVDGYLLVVARNAHQIYKVSLDGEFELWAGSGEKGGKDGAKLAASFCFPNDIALGADGKTVYINEVADHESMGRKLAPTRVRVVKP